AWLSGVALIAGILALAGAYSSRWDGLALLLAAGTVSLWFAISQAGYLGKVMAYPGCLLLWAVFLASWPEPRPSALLVAALLGAGTALCHNPMTVLVVLGGAALASIGASLAIGLPSRYWPQFE